MALRHTSLCWLPQVMGTLMASFAEGLTLSKQAGLSQEDFIKVVNWSWKHSNRLKMG